ncbi:MAG TPA: hypothetical protein DD670_02285 [Planctomycetaceae bacterium]|nr:hypothetical protein [Planctomycetaceae bacterium]
MRIGYYVQGAADEAFVHGLAKRWCPQAELAQGKFRGRSRESHRREIKNALIDLRDNHRCDVLVVLTDSDTASWREVKQREWKRVPKECEDLTVFGVAERNIECWLAIDRHMLASELGCDPNDIPSEDPSGFVKRCLGIGERDTMRDEAKRRIQDFMATPPRLKTWIEGSPSFKDFYNDIRLLGSRRGCQIVNELDPV